MESNSRAPSGLILFALIALAASAGFIRLGVWQLDRHREVRGENAARADRIALAQLQLDASLVATTPTDSLLWRRVEISGSWELDRVVVIRSRARSGTPGIHVVTPLRLHNEAEDSRSTVVLVLRGWQPSPEAATSQRGTETAEPGIDEEAPRLALVRESRTAQGGPMVELRTDSGRIRSFAAIDVAMIAGGGDETAPFFLQLLPTQGDVIGSSGEPIPVPLPALDDGPHLTYAIQWFSFALITLVGSIAFLRRERRTEDVRRPARP